MHSGLPVLTSASLKFGDAVSQIIHHQEYNYKIILREEILSESEVKLKHYKPKLVVAVYNGTWDYLKITQSYLITNIIRSLVI